LSSARKSSPLGDFVGKWFWWPIVNGLHCERWNPKEVFPGASQRCNIDRNNISWGFITSNSKYLTKFIIIIICAIKKARIVVHLKVDLPISEKIKFYSLLTID